MRLLMRSSVYRPIDGVGLEVAASPDTPGREPWLWHLRLVTEGHSGQLCHDLPARHAPLAKVVLDVEESISEASLETRTIPPGESLEIHRNLAEVTSILILSGEGLIERRRLRSLDVIVLEGDDPLSTVVYSEGSEELRIEVARVRARGSRKLGWVP